MPFIFELQRRNVLRTAIAYLAGAWLVTEVCGTLFDIFGAPDWAIRLVVVLLAIGILPALVFSWAYELTPEGIKRDVGDGRVESVSRRTARRLDLLTALSVAIALLVILAHHLWLDTERADPDLAVAADTDRHPPSASPADPGASPSLAVLPFVNMSADETNEYFSDGVSEELISLLSRVPGLRVTSRSSTFSFKGRDVVIPAVAEQLNVTHILEGSVRKSGDRVRITTQLIEAASDTHVWSESWDRMLGDIFAVQEEIARAVTRKLELTLLDAEPVVRKTDPEAYTAFLKARRLALQFTVDAFGKSDALYRQALAIDPGYAAAWSGLAANFINQTTVGQLPSAAGVSLAREAARRALEVDPDHAPALAQLGIIALRYDRDLPLAARHLQHALSLEPGNPDILMHSATLNRTLGRMEQAIAINRRVVERDPINPVSHYFLGFSYLWAQRWDEAVDSFQDALMLSPDHVSAHYRIAQALYYKGEVAAALEAAGRERRTTKRLMGLAMICHAMGRHDESDAALAQLVDDHEKTASYNIAYLRAFRGERDLAFEWLRKAVQYNDPGLPQITFQPEFASIRNDPRWAPFLESIGMAPAQLAAIELQPGR